MTKRVLVVVKRTSYRKFVVEDHDAHIEKLIARGDPAVKRMRRSHEDHEETVGEVRRALKSVGARFDIVAGPRNKFDPSNVDLVVTVGGDGTLLTVSHQIGEGTPLLGVNSAPDHSVGFFCGARKGKVEEFLELALEGKLRKTHLTRMRVDLNGKLLHARVLNEALVCHASPAATSRYILRITRGNRAHAEEEQRSSGIWVGPAAGSTAAQKSAGGKVLPITSKKIQFVVREPYTPIGVPFRFPMGLIDEDGSLTLHSKMHETKIFLDGPHAEHDATIGDVLTMRRSEETLTVLGMTRKRGAKNAGKSPLLGA